MIANIYIEQFLQKFTSRGPGLISIDLPPDQTNGKPPLTITGVLASDVNVSVQTKYGPLIPDMTDLADLFAIAGQANIPTWVGASAQSWKGTDPITFGVEMYLINYSPDLDHENSLKELTKMCTLEIGSSVFRAAYHRGYSPDILANNKQLRADAFFNGLKDALKVGSSGGQEGGDKGTIPEQLSKVLGYDGVDIQGTITVRIGSNFSLSRLLLTKVDVSPSLVEVSATEEGPGKPLYYRVGMSFMTCRAALSEDVDGMFGGYY